MAPTDTAWTEDSVTRLRELRDEEHPTAEVGRRLSTTKNAVVGEAHRLALPPRPSPIRWGEGADEPSAPTPGSAPAMARPAHLSGGTPARLTAARAAPTGPVPGPSLPHRPALPRRCRWPLGEPGHPGFRSREAAVDAGKPCCPAHRAPAYAKSPRPRSDRHAP